MQKDTAPRDTTAGIKTTPATEPTGGNWDDLRIVLAAARRLSFAGAARVLGVNESTVARRVAAAERRLQTRLFERVQGQLTPTEAGRRAVAEAERIELAVQALDGAIAGSDALAAGGVRLTSVPIVVNRLLMPALGALLRRHPQLRLELVAEPRTLSLTRREADIALRLARPTREARALTRRIGRLDYAVYASRAALARPATDPDARAARRWIGYDDSLAELPQSRWLARRLAGDGERAAPLVVNDAETLLQGIRAGLGRSLLPVAVGDREPDLRRAGDGAVVCRRELWTVVHPELRALKRIQVVLDWLEATVGDAGARG